VGFEVLDVVAGRHGLIWESAPAEALMAKWRAVQTVLVKPLTFMNLSGFAVQQVMQFYKVELPSLLVVVDEVQLELGRLRARRSGSAGGHNGLKSLISQLGSTEFARLRIGIGRGDSRRDLADHVLSRFEPDERPIVIETVNRSADAVELFVTEGIGQVMNRFNRREDREGGESDAGSA
jgi:PTH1 family peptidyl-tRNA hydrolase